MKKIPWARQERLTSISLFLLVLLVHGLRQNVMKMAIPATPFQTPTAPAKSQTTYSYNPKYLRRQTQ